jgi:flagellar basal body-associated protein FliL
MQSLALILIAVNVLFIVGLVVAFFVMLKKGKHAAKLAEHTEELVAKAAGHLSETVKHQS